MDPTMAAGFHLIAGDEGEANWGVTCSDHGLYRTGLYRVHAVNTEAKHRRDFHDQPWPDLNLSAVATLVLMAATIEVNPLHDAPADWVPDPSTTAVLGLWESLTGLPRTEAVEMARRVQASRVPIVAYVSPL